MTTYVIPFGTSDPLDCQLTSEGVNLDGTGLTPTLEIKKWVNAAAETVTSPPTVAWLSQAGGTVRVTGTGSLALGNYLVRYKLTNGASEIGFVPNGDRADLWRVVPVAAR